MVTKLTEPQVLEELSRTVEEIDGAALDEFIRSLSLPADEERSVASALEMLPGSGQRPTAQLLPSNVTAAIKSELLDTVRAAHLGRELEDAVLGALGGPTRVLPEGKANQCAALTYLTYSSAACDDSLQVVPAVAAMEMLVATGDVIDDIQDGEAALPQDRRSMGRTLETMSLLLMLCHSAIGRLADRGVPASRVVRVLQIIDALGLDALTGQRMDMDLETRREVSVDECLDASRLKSASLTRCAAEMGATLGTDDLHKIDLFAQFGWHLGIVMQLMNDVAGVWPGGPDKSDLRLRKKTLPIAFALNLPHDSSRHAREVRSYYDSGESPSISEDTVRWALWRCGAIHFTWIVAARERAQAEQVGRNLSEGRQKGWALARLLA